MADGNARPPDAPRTHSDVLWQPRAPAEVGQSVARYSRFVARAKIALPVAAGVILLLVLLLPQFRAESERFRISLKKIAEIATDSVSATNVRYNGADSSGRPFVVTVVRAHERTEENADGTKLIDLTGPTAEFSTGDGKRVKVSATSGAYDRPAEMLELNGDVVLVHDQGYEMHTSSARVNLKENTATGNEPVTVTGDFGEVKGAGFTARQNDKVLDFTGPATLVLNQKKSSPTPKPEEKQP